MGLNLTGHDARMLVRVRESDDRHVIRIERSGALNMARLLYCAAVQRAINRSRTSLTNTFFSIPYPGFDLAATEAVRGADIINLHWVGKFQSVESIARLLFLDKPVVWTLHDENPFTGGCHYTAGCEGFLSNCEQCPQLPAKLNKLPQLVLQAKKSSWQKNLTIVTPSRWLAGRAQSSALFRHVRIEVIPNSLETDIFHPSDKQEAKQRLNIDPDVFCLLFNAFDHEEKRKGLHLLPEIFERCRRVPVYTARSKERRVLLLCLGNAAELPELPGTAVRSFGHIQSPSELAAIYSAADVFLLPSLEDNLPNTMLEAMACGTPVISFQVGGMPEVIQDDVHGYTVPKVDPAVFAEKIVHLMAADDTRKKMSAACRTLIEDTFRLEHQANAYARLFSDLCGEKGRAFQRKITAGQPRGNQWRLQLVMLRALLRYLAGC
jgi:glycosyltransferase involved in cell wall biosynthesis